MTRLLDFLGFLFVAFIVIVGLSLVSLDGQDKQTKQTEIAAPTLTNAEKEELRARIAKQTAPAAPSIEVISDLSDGWKKVRLTNEGLSLDVPGQSIDCKPVAELDAATSRCYQFIPSKEAKEALVTIWANHLDGGLFSDEAIDAWFKGANSGFAPPQESASISYDRRISFLGFPASETAVASSANGIPTMTRRLRFVVDGSEIVLSVAAETHGDFGQNLYDRIKASMNLAAIEYRPAKSGSQRYSMVSITAPSGWIEEAGTNAAELVRFRNLTKMIIVKAAGQRSYQCTDYRHAVEQQFYTSDESAPTFEAAGVMVFTTLQPVQDFDLNLKVIHYCWESSRGAVAIEAVSEEQTFERWRRVFDGTAQSLTIH